MCVCVKKESVSAALASSTQLTRFILVRKVIGSKNNNNKNKTVIVSCFFIDGRANLCQRFEDLPSGLEIEPRSNRTCDSRDWKVGFEKLRWNGLLIEVLHKKWPIRSRSSLDSIPEIRNSFKMMPTAAKQVSTDSGDNGWEKTLKCATGRKREAVL